MYKKLKKVSKNRNKLIAVVTVLFIGMIFASVLLGTITTDISYGDENSHSSSVAEERETGSKLDTSATSGKISINDAGSNNWAWAKAQGICTGSGTQTDPYIIEYLTINCRGSGSGIKIENSNAYFVIRYCTIYNSGGGSNAGIKLKNTDNGYIIGNDCSQNNYGIYLETSNNHLLFVNTVNYNDYYGILLSYSNNNQICATTTKHNPHGIYLGSSNDNYLWGNIANENQIAIWVDNSHNNEILKNSANDNFWGLYIISSNTNEIYENNVNNNDYAGIWIEDSDYNQIYRNNINDNAMGIGISGNSFTNTIISNKISIASPYNTWGIYVHGSNSNIILQNTITACPYGVHLVYNSDYNYVWWNTLIHCTNPIVDDGGRHNSIKDNTIIP